MESVLGRYRNLVILVGVLFLQVLGLATQVKRGGGNDPESTRLIRIWAVGAISPFERALVWGENGVGNLWHSYFYLRGVRAENRQLKNQIEQMRLEQVRLSEDAVVYEMVRRCRSAMAGERTSIRQRSSGYISEIVPTDFRRGLGSTRRLTSFPPHL